LAFPNLGHEHNETLRRFRYRTVFTVGIDRLGFDQRGCHASPILTTLAASVLANAGAGW